MTDAITSLPRTNWRKCKEDEASTDLQFNLASFKRKGNDHCTSLFVSDNIYEQDSSVFSGTCAHLQHTSMELKFSLDDTARFIGDLLKLARNRKPRAASDLVFAFFEDRLEKSSATDIAECDIALQLINNIRFTDFTDTEIVAVLVATYPSRNRLISRSTFVEHAHRYLTDAIGETDADFIKNCYR